MQASALYDPRAAASPLQRKAIEASLERQRRMKAAAVQAAAQSPADKTERSRSAALVEAKPLRPAYEVMWFYDLVLFAESWIPGMPAAKPRLRIDQIQKAVAEFYSVSVRDIISSRRTANIVKPRQVGYFLSKALTLQSLPEIGRRFGGRDHSSALHGIRKIERLRETDERLESELRTIAHSLGGALA